LSGKKIKAKQKREAPKKVLLDIFEHGGAVSTEAVPASTATALQAIIRSWLEPDGVIHSD
jgi:hypothetical protein